MSCLLDVSVLMAVLWETHDENPRASAWLDRVDEFCTCPLTQLGFARVSAHPHLGYGVSVEHAFTTLRRLLADPRHRFISDDLSATDRALHTELMRGPQQITDRYLTALARQHGLMLATLDEPLARAFADEPNLVTVIR